MKPARTYRMIGLMSGTSLDGLDMACVKFSKDRRWSYEVLQAVTVPYSREWSSRLAEAHTLPAEAMIQLHAAYGRFLGTSCAKFIRERRIRYLDGIASHGHTVFHQPDKGFTFQLGDGNAIHAATGLTVVSDFRSLDVHLGGEGAPLVPVGDRLLFPTADLCLNLGGIANVSMEIKGKRMAFDICFCNLALNHLAREAGKTFDRYGRMAAKGTTDPGLRKRLSGAYAAVRKKRKSLGREYFEAVIRPLLDEPSLSLSDRLRTVCESIADEIELTLPSKRRNIRMLTTGGGAWNRQLLEILRSRLAGKATVVLPSPKIINFKEAIIFAFLGLLRMRNENNVLSSVTRGKRDSCSGIMVGRTAPL
jgi:anhydro-N-acetylmuramic acid kinase